MFFFIFLKNNDLEKKLGNDYYYTPFEEDIFDATTFGGNGIYKFQNNNRIPIIFPRIIKYKNDSSYIIVKQKFDFFETKKLIQNMLFMPDIYFKYDHQYVQLNND
jgi:hypothetical protein